MKKSFRILWLYVAFICTPALSIQATGPIKSYDTPLTIAAIALNLPYPLYTLYNKKESPYSKLWYSGDHQAALWNHSLNLINFAALSSELPVKYLFLTGAILTGIQTSTYVFSDAQGVSLVWSGLTGMLLHRLCIQKVVKWHLALTILLNSATIVYYAYKLPAITTIAHLGGLAGGFTLSLLLPYKK